MSESTSILADVWEVTRRHISGEAQGHNQPGLDFHAPEFINEIGSMRYNLEDLSGISNDSTKDRYDTFGAFSWIKVVVAKVCSNALPDEDYAALELNILRLTAVWAHNCNLRIKTFIEYFQSIKDDYVVNYILALGLIEKYSEFGIDDEQATWLSAKLSGSELETMMNEDLTPLLRKENIDAARYQQDKFEWLQAIKHIIGNVSAANTEHKIAMLDGDSDDNSSPSTSAEILNGEIHQVLVLQNERILLSFAYAEVINSGNDPMDGTEIIGCYCGSPEDWGYFYWTGSVDHAPAVTEEFEETKIIGVWEVIGQLEEARNSLLNIDENTSEIIGLSQTGQEFIEGNSVDHGDNGLLIISTESAELDYIHDIQNQWSLELNLN